MSSQFLYYNEIINQSRGTDTVGAMRKELLAGSYIQADETPVDVQTHDKRGKNHQVA